MRKPSPVRARLPFRKPAAMLAAYLTLITPLAPALAQSVKSGRAQTAAPATAAAKPSPKGGAATPGKRVTPPAPRIAANAPSITATKTDNLAQSALVQPGGTINYAVTITNGGTADAAGVSFADTIDANTALTAGTLAVTPLALADTYNAATNAQFNQSAPGVLSNDIDPLTGTSAGLAVTSYGASTGAEQTTPGSSTPTSQGGAVALNSDGSFAYTPANDFQGADTFKYKITHGAFTDTATVTVVVDAPPSVTTTTPVNNATGVALSSTITVNFSEPVNAASGFATINCGSTVAYTPTTASNTGSVVLIPTGGLPAGSDCTVTVDHTKITDVDTNDPPDNMAADYAFSFKVNPNAVDDAYSVTLVGNVSTDSSALSTPFSVTANNDVSAAAYTITAVSGSTTIVSNTITATSANGGNVVMTVSGAGLGKFTYNPPAGFEGTGANSDTFTYTISRTDGGGSDTATVSIPVSGMVWFVNNSAASCTAVSSGCGRLSNPFSTLAAFNSVNDGVDNTGTHSFHPAAGDNVFIYTGGGSYAGPLTLLSNQKLVGQGATASLSTVTGLTPPAGSPSFPPTGGTRPTLTVASGTDVTLGAGNTVRGLNVNSSGNGTTALAGTSFNNLTLSETTVTANNNNSGACAAAINLAQASGTASISATFVSVSASNCTNGVVVSNTSGSFTVAGSGSTAGSGGTVQNTTGNGASFTNAANVSLSNMNFTGDDSSAASSSCSDMTSAFFGSTVTCNAVIFLSNVSTVSLTNDTLDGLNSTSGTHAQNGIYGSVVSAFTLSGGEIKNMGYPSDNDVHCPSSNVCDIESGILFSNLSGTSSISNANIHDNAAWGLDIRNTTGTLTLSINNSTFGTVGNGTGSSDSGAGAIRFLADGAGSQVMNLDVEGSNLGTSSNPLDGYGVQANNLSVIQASNAHMNLKVGVTGGNHIYLNGVRGVPLSFAVAGGTGSGASEQPGVMTFDIENNDIHDSAATSISINLADNPATGLNTPNTSIGGTINNNTIGTAGSALSGGKGNGIQLWPNSSGKFTVAATNNQIYETGGDGIQVQTTEQPTVNVTLKGNTINIDKSNRNDILVQNGRTSTTPQDSATLCADISGNTLSDSPTAFSTGFGIHLEQISTGAVSLPHYGGGSGPTDTTSVQNFEISQNTFSTGATTREAFARTGSITYTSTGGYVAGGSGCASPPAVATAKADTPDAVSPTGKGGLTSPLTSTPAETFFTSTFGGFDPRAAQAAASPGSAEARVSVTPAEAQATDAPAPAPREWSDIPAGRAHHTAPPVNSPYTADLGSRGDGVRFISASYEPGGGPAPVSRAAGRSELHATNHASSVTSAALFSGETVTVNGSGSGFTLPAGKSVTITFSVTVNNSLPNGTSSVSNQGAVSGSNFANVLTDDPDTASPNDATVTQVLTPPDIRANDAKVAEPQTGQQVTMLFTVTLNHAFPPSGTSVSYSTADGTASGGNSCDGSHDYVSVSGGTLNFSAAETVKTLPVTVCSTGIASDRTFTLNLTTNVNTSGQIVDAQATGTITAANTPGTLIISEIRTSGPTSLANDFVELYNNTANDLTVPAGGYGLFKMGADCDAAPVLVGIVPANATIKARGHYLLTGSGYSLSNYGGANAAPGDAQLNVTPSSPDIESDSNVALFSTTDPAQLSTATRLDAVGFGANTGSVCDLLREGTNLPALSGSTLEYSFFRNEAVTGQPTDTNDNSADFLFADTAATSVAGVQRLGAPGPENLSSPVNRGATIKATLFDPAVSSSTVPNRDRSAAAVTNGASGTLVIRRTYTNNTGGTVTRLRFRVVDMTAGPGGGAGVADVRLLDTSAGSTTITGGGSKSWVAMTVEQPPTQSMGGGVNSTVTAVPPGGSIAPGNSVSVQFTLGVMTPGSFRFFIIVEALP